MEAINVYDGKKNDFFPIYKGLYMGLERVVIYNLFGLLSTFELDGGSERDGDLPRAYINGPLAAETLAKSMRRVGLAAVGVASIVGKRVKSMDALEPTKAELTRGGDR